MDKICLGLNGFASSEHAHGLRFTLDEILSHAQQLGYDGIELFPFHEPYPSDAAGRRALRKLYNSYNLLTPALQSASRGHAASPDQRLRDDYVESIREMLDFAHDIDADLVGVWSGEPLRDVPGGEQVKWVLDTYQRCTLLAVDAGLTLALEAEPVQAINSLNDLLTVLDGINSPAFLTIFDFAHAAVLSGGHPMDFMHSLLGRIGHVHFTDNDGHVLPPPIPGASGTSAHLAVGDGNLDLDALLNLLKESDYARWLQVDVWENPDPYRASRLGIEFLSRWRASHRP